MRLWFTGLCCLIFLIANSVWAGSAAAFEPDVTKVVPAVGDHFDLTLLRAGKAMDRWKRANSLRQSLPDVKTVDPLNDTQPLFSWLAVMAMLEGAVSVGPDAPEAWEKDLLEVYRSVASAEPAFRMFAAAARVARIKRIEGSEGLDAFSRQLDALPAHCRDGVRWLAKRRLSKKPSDDLRRALLSGLVDVHRRDGRFQDMERAASTLVDLAGDGADHAALAEARFELGRLTEGRKALAAARKAKAPKEDLGRATLRERLAGVQAALSKRETPKGLAEKAGLFQKLGEPWRIKKTFSAKRVVQVGDSKLDEIYLDALLDDGFDYAAAWDFARLAKGTPATPGFRGRRIGAGLAKLLEGLFGASGKPVLDPNIRRVIREDLDRFAKHEPRLAELVGLYLEFLGALAGQDVYALAKRMKGEVAAFVRRRPGDLAGVQLAYLIGQLNPDADDPWTVVQRYKKALGKKEAPIEFLSLYAGGAIRKSIKSRSVAPVQEVLTWLNGNKARAGKPDGMLWRSHLLAVSGLMAEGQQQGQSLQAAVDAYGKTLTAWGEAKPPARDPAILCAGGGSLVTLLMQGSALEQAQQLLGQVAGMCGQDPDLLALVAVVSIAQGVKPEGMEGTPVELLAQVLPAASSRQIQIQGRLWLALVAEANGLADEAKAMFAQAASAMGEERTRGAPVVLAPDLRSLVALSGQFDMGVGHALDSPFGLAIQVSVRSRMMLFPPAAVSPDKLSKYPELKDNK